jgi:hypothetical protein
MEKLTAKFKINDSVLDSLLNYPDFNINHIIQRQMSDIITNELQKKLEITDKFDRETNTTEYSTEFLLLNKSDVDYIMLNLKNIMYRSEQGWNDQIPSKLKNIQEFLLYGKKEI